MQDPANSTFGLVGVAPEAELGAYRVFGCSGGAPQDVCKIFGDTLLLFSYLLTMRCFQTPPKTSSHGTC
jgi:hypothetical protein